MKMKKTLLLISLLSLAVLTGCREAETDIDIPVPSGKAVRTARVRVGFAEAPGTKSQVTVDVEDFTEAYLFAFWASGAAAARRGRRSKRGLPRSAARTASCRRRCAPLQR